MNRFTRLAMRAPLGLYRARIGGVLGRRFLMLEHTGRRSGLVRRAVLEVVEIGGDGVPVIVSGFGTNADWYRNVIADPQVHYTHGWKRRKATAVPLSLDEAVEVFDRYRVNHPKAATVIGERLGVSIIDDVAAAASQLPLFRLEPAVEG